MTTTSTPRRVLVTGGGRGIGATIVERFASAGAHVIVNYARSEAAAAALVTRVREGGGSAEAVRANLARPDEIAALGEVLRQGGPLDVLVHNAAIGAFKPFIETRANQWDLTMNVNARALLLLARELRTPLEARRGRIVALSSLGGQRVIDAYGAIGVSKAALEAVTRYLAVELAGSGITVNALAAGLVSSSSLVAHPDYAVMAESVRARTPTGRLLTAEDVADMVLWLCDPRASSVVGQTIVADGGFSLR